jgi:hypothetical protein
MGITFKINTINNGLAYGTLKWPEKGLSTGAFSGPYGRHELPQGLYHAQRHKLLDKEGQPGYCDSLNKCWIQPLDPQFSTDRNNLGIHPDGNKVGTLGCIGLLDANTAPWYDAFYSLDHNDFVTVEVI